MAEWLCQRVGFGVRVIWLGKYECVRFRKGSWLGYWVLERRSSCRKSGGVGFEYFVGVREYGTIVAEWLRQIWESGSANGGRILRQSGSARFGRVALPMGLGY